MERAQRGRPPLPEDRVKAKMLLVRLSTAEHATLETAAKRAEQPLSTWARETLLSTAERLTPHGPRNRIKTERGTI